MDPHQSVSVPSILFFGVISALAVKYFFFNQASPLGGDGSDGRRASPQEVEQLAAMFPQISRRDIMWDLQRPGGSTTATTERILSSGRLDSAPRTFQPASLDSTPTSQSGANGVSSSSKTAKVDLIERYNLSEKLSSQHDDPATSTGRWSADKSERQALLQKRRDDMILNARRKLQAKQQD